MANADEWIEVPSNRPGSRFFVRPTSYVLMDPAERERKWQEDVANHNYPASLWIEAMRQLRESEPDDVFASLL